jgi:hypothetical protein
MRNRLSTFRGWFCLAMAALIGACVSAAVAHQARRRSVAAVYAPSLTAYPSPRWVPDDASRRPAPLPPDEWAPPAATPARTASRAVPVTGRSPARAAYPAEHASPRDARPAGPSPVAGPQARYRTLLKRVNAPKDRESYGDFCDFGYWSGTAYAGQTDLPPGYWVYLAPTWHIFKEPAASAQPATAVPTAVVPTTVPPTTPALSVEPADGPVARWGPEQAVGKPDTAAAGDVPTAWASATPDGQREWLDLTYAEADTEAVGVLVYETYNPGAVDGVVATVGGGEQVEVWAGKDPTDPGKPMGVSVLHFKTPVKTTRVRVSLDSPRVAGWNEIDAVGLLGADGTVRWATAVTASSTYGVSADPTAFTTYDQRLAK